MVTKLTCFTDANWAGCLTTRRSTTCVALFHGDDLVKFSSQTQIPVAISVGESEFYALTKGAAQALGLQSICIDWGLSYAVDIHTDSSSSIGTASRRGAGKLRHIETRLLWIQQIIAKRVVTLRKTPGVRNPADLGTKILGGPQIAQHCRRLGLEIRAGTHPLALRTAATT